MNRQLKEQIDRLPDEVAPQRDLWPGIEHSLKKPRQGIQVPVWGMAAAVALVAVSLTWSLMRPVSVQPSASDLSALVSLLHDENESAKQVLLASFEDRVPYYPEWQTELEQLEEAEDVLLEALMEDSGNTALISLLRQVQQKQLNLIDAVYSPRLTSL